MRALAFVLALCLALPVRAEPTQSECALAPPLTAGVPPAQLTLDCLQSRVARLKQDAADAEARRVEAAVGQAACEATSAIACPAPRFPVVEVTFAALGGFVAGAVVVLVAFLAPR